MKEYSAIDKDLFVRKPIGKRGVNERDRSPTCK